MVIFHCYVSLPEGKFECAGLKNMAEKGSWLAILQRHGPKFSTQVGEAMGLLQWIYRLVNIQKTMENHHCSLESSLFLW